LNLQGATPSWRDEESLEAARPKFERGYGQLFWRDYQADQGCDFKFLHAGKGPPEAGYL